MRTPTGAARGRGPARAARDRGFARFIALVSLLPVGLLALLGAVLAAKALPLLGSGLDLFGLEWRPDSGHFGLWPFIAGTAAITAIAMLIAVPICTRSAWYLSFFAGRRVRAVGSTLLDLLAGVPSVVFGLWGVLVIVPFVRDVLAPALEGVLGFIPIFSAARSSGYSVLAGGVVLAFMVAPYMISMMGMAMKAVPTGYMEASLSLGATRWEAARHAVYPRCRKGVYAAAILGLSRAIGETMAVMMVVGNVPTAPGSIFDPAYPLPALIANEYGEVLSIPRQEGALMGAALVLLLVVGAFNVGARLVFRRLVAGGAR